MRVHCVGWMLLASLVVIRAFPSVDTERYRHAVHPAMRKQPQLDSPFRVPSESSQLVDTVDLPQLVDSKHRPASLLDTFDALKAASLHLAPPKRSVVNEERPKRSPPRRRRPKTRRVERPSHCGRSNSVYANCYLCGRMVADKRIYLGCCAQRSSIMRFCRRLFD